MTARVHLPERDLTLISLHARTEPSLVENIEALFDQLEPFPEDGSFVLAGDFNSCRIEAEKTWPGYRHREFFEGVEANYAVHNCYWKQHQTEPRTYWPKCQEVGRAYQDDHIFVSADLKDLVRSAVVLGYGPFRGISDHTPIAIDIDLE